MLKSGIYEQVINELIRQEHNLDRTRLWKTTPIEEDISSDMLTQYVSELVRKCLQRVPDSKDRITKQIQLTNQILALLEKETSDPHLDGTQIDPNQPEQLLAILDRREAIQPHREQVDWVRPITSISRTSLFTGAAHEPSLVTELKKEIQTADRIDMLVSFIKWSGLRLLLDDLRQFVARGGALRIITTTYMGATDPKAIEELSRLAGVEIRISYDTKRTRLHAKTYIFYRNSGFTTAYIGSSNLSNAAISSGLEWNIKVTAKDLPDTIAKIEATYESYWGSREFSLYRDEDQGRLRQAIRSERTSSTDQPSFHFDITPYSFQQEILDMLSAERAIHQRWRNLVVTATGTGKTVISAFDYRNYCYQNPGKQNRLLFVAHREEILKQSISCFQAVLRDPNFGDLYVGDFSPSQYEYLFISIQTIQSSDFTRRVSPTYYDFIIVDEFHHAAAPTYQAMLEYFEPKVLLGLTATPERMDGKSVLSYFDHQIAAEIRLPEAIERKLLSPFHYFGVSDTVDLSDLKWARGGYDRNELSKIFSMNHAIAQRRAQHIVSSLTQYVADIDSVKGLGFCVSIEHADFMADFFNQSDIPSMSLNARSSDEDRKNAKRLLTNGSIRFIFVVDLYNEGVDIPEINTVLFLRPTESLTIFLQQLGRGLRLHPDKDCLTVLDFIGQANKRYDFESKYLALLAKTAPHLTKEIKNGFASVPKGCFIHLEKKAAQHVLENISSSYRVYNAMISKIQSFPDDTDLPLTLSNFATHHHIDLRAIYSRDTFSRLCVKAGVQLDFDEPEEETFQKAFLRISMIDSRRWLKFLLEVLPQSNQLDFRTLSEMGKTYLLMFHYTFWQTSIKGSVESELRKGLQRIHASPTLLSELMEILNLRFESIDFIDTPANLGYVCPLDIHCHYSRDQILVALGHMDPSDIREGVKYLPDLKTDVFFITLNKSEKEFKPTTMYHDYSIDETLFHWQSQSTTSADSPTGLRYIRHQTTSNQILLFVRDQKKDEYTTSPYTFLGPADYISHTGSRPMSIIWRLHHAIPMKYLRTTSLNEVI